MDWRTLKLNSGCCCRCKVWKSPRSKPRGSTSGAIRWRFGVLGLFSWNVLLRDVHCSSLSTCSCSCSSLFSADSLLRLFIPRGAVLLGPRFVILFRGVRPCVSVFLVRKRNLCGEESVGISACCVGGEGSWEGIGDGWSMEWRARHVEKRLLRAGGVDVEEEDGGGERGGEAKSMRDWNLVFGVEGCEGSHAKADGRSMVAGL